MKKILSFLLIISLIITLCSCTSEKKPFKKIIAVSIVPQATFVEKVCGDEYEIITMIPPGASAETYEVTIAELAQLESAELYFSIGVPSEKNTILPSIKDKEKIVPLHTAAQEVYPAVTIGNEHDPHIWLSPKRVIVMVQKIADSLSIINPEKAEKYRKNADNYCDALSKLDAEITDLFKSKQNRKFMVFHPAFGYIAEDYSLTMYALEEHGKEADAKHLSEMTDLAKKEDITTVFYQAETSGRQAEAFAEEIGGKAVELNPLSPDYIENMRALTKALSEAMK